MNLAARPLLEMTAWLVVGFLCRSVSDYRMEYRGPRGRGAGGRAQRLLILEGT